MKKKKVIFINNHFQYSDGTVTALIGLVNHLDPEKYDITIKPLYRCDRRREVELREGIKLEKGFGFYFRGFAKIAKLIPLSILYRKFIGKKYDIEIAFQCDIPTLLIGKSPKKEAVHVAWMHCFGLFPESYEKCDKVVCVSKYCADKTKQEMGDRVDVTYLYNLVNDSIILEKAKESVESFSKEYPTFVTVGRNSPEKGYDRLIRILYELKEEGYKFQLILIGDGPQHEELVQLIKELKMEEYIKMIGQDDNPHKYTAKSDLFVCSSFDEGYSTACTEAAILGVPIVTTDVPGGEEIIDDCECGILTTKEDESLKAALKTVLQHPEVLSEWKETMKTTCEKFRMKKRVQAVNELFDEFYQLSEEKQKK